jgi:hypothetical protein
MITEEEKQKRIKDFILAQEAFWRGYDYGKKHKFFTSLLFFIRRLKDEIQSKHS